MGGGSGQSLRGREESMRSGQIIKPVLLCSRERGEKSALTKNRKNHQRLYKDEMAIYCKKVIPMEIALKRVLEKNKRGSKSSSNLKTKPKEKKRRLLIMKKEIWDVQDPRKGLCCNKGEQPYGGWLLELGCLVPITLPLQKMPSISSRAEHFAKYAI